MNLFRLIGNTPLIQVTLFSDEFPDGKVFGKAEFVNPGGSLKDRPVARMLSRAIDRGDLRNGMVILDSSSGNAGIAYSMLGNAMGFEVEIIMPGNVSRERLLRIKAHGARVISTDPLEGYDAAIVEVHKRFRENPGKYFFSNQYSNEDNWLSHYESTAVEILEQCPGLTHFVGGIGTGGSITGIARRLKKHSSAIRVIGVIPERFPGIEGLKPLGETGDIIPEILDQSVIDEFIPATADEARENCHRLARTGIFAGQSSGAYMTAVQKLLEKEPDAVVVTLLNDGGERYFSAGLWKD